jgi:hypothetical protein
MSSLQQNWTKRQNRFCLKARRVGERGRGREAEGRNEPKQCMHILIKNY